MAEIIDIGGKITISLSNSESIYIRRDKMIQSEGAVRVSVATPSPQKATIARLLNHLFFMQKIDTDRSGGHITLTCNSGKQLIEIRLSHEEQLAVCFSHLIAFSSRIHFASFANLSLAAFACDRNFSTIVRGPGRLLLETNGNHVLYEDGQVVMDPSQLVAWDPKTRFHLDQIHSLTDLYLNRLRISCSLNKELFPLILDSAPRTGVTNANPLIDNLKAVYWPRFF
jgi:uncharacterized protein (AIM24 family)